MTPKHYNARDEFRRIMGLWQSGSVKRGCMLDRLCRFYVWCHSGFCKIRDVHGQIVSLRANPAQLRIHVAMMRQAEAGKPVRVVIGKARKVGSSTWVEAFQTYLCCHYKNQRALTIAHESEATDEIFTIAKRVSQEYTLGRDAGDELRQREIRFGGTKSVYHCRTAGGEAVGAGGTPSSVHLSEIPKWSRNRRETLYNATISVPDVPLSVIVLESTFKGREAFWEVFDRARKGSTDYEAVFIPWFLDAACRLKCEGPLVYDDAERRLLKTASDEGVELSNDQLYWRRKKIAEPQVGAEIFRQEYPSTPEEAVQAAEGLILPGMRQCLIDELPFDLGSIPWACMVGGYDGGYNDPCVIVSGFYVDQVVYVTDVWRGVETLAAEQVGGLIEGHRYYCDPSGLSDRCALQGAAWDAGLHCRLNKAPRRKHPGEDSERAELQQVIDLMRRGRLKVMRGVSDRLVAECDDLLWDDRTGKPKMPRTAAGHFDVIMAVKYMVMGCIKRQPGLTPTQHEGIYVQNRRAQFAR